MITTKIDSLGVNHDPLQPQPHFAQTEIFRPQDRSIEMAPNNTSKDDQHLKPDMVNLSENGLTEAKKASIRESLTETVKTLRGEDSNKAEQTKDPLEQLLEDTKEKIQQIKQQIAELQNKEDEQSKQQLELLNQQLLALTAQLMTLNTRKLEGLSAKSA